MKIPFSALDKQHEFLLDELMASVESVFRSGSFILGKEVSEFEQRFANYHGRKFAIGVASGTDALIIPLRAMGIGQGDEVITAVNTFITTVSSIALLGATPVLVDAGNDDNIDVAQIEKNITERTKAILPVHWTGRPCDMEKILTLAQKYRLRIIEDCAQAVSARFKGQLVGTFGDVGSFSLHPFKTLNACGDAGVIITDDEVLVEAMLALRQNGLSKTGACHHWSNNSRLDAMQASILNVKFKYFEEWTKRRLEIASFYAENLQSVIEINLPKLPDNDYYSVFHTYIIKAKNRDGLQQYLKEQGIETRIHYQVPIHRQPVAKKLLGDKVEDFPRMDYLSRHTLSLPIYPELKQEELMTIVSNIKSFYQAEKEKKMRVPYSYLERQFSDIEPYLNDLREFVKTTDFTIGAPLLAFEKQFAKLHGAPHAIGVGTGTDALAMSLKILGIGVGDEVITCANTFIATVGAIVQAGATPVFVDSENGYVIDVDKIEQAITSKTKAIMPVHYTGNIADMPRITELAKKHNLYVVEDACQTILGRINDKHVGSWGETAAFSLHPLKNLNVWSDAGVIITHSDAHAEKLRLYRNHGLVDRDVCVEFGINCRMDTIQAVIANRLINQLESITEKRIGIAHRYDQAFADLKDFIDVPNRRRGVNHVFHIYVLRVKYRDQLHEFLSKAGIEVKIHYPIPMHLQPAAQYLGYKKGDFPVAEAHGAQVITLPAHPYLTEQEIEYTIAKVREFYRDRHYAKSASGQRAVVA